MNQKGEIKGCLASDLKYRNDDLTGWFCPIHRHVYIARHDGSLKSGICGEVSIATADSPWWDIESMSISWQDDFHCAFKRKTCACGTDLMVPKAVNKEHYDKFLTKCNSIDLNQVEHGISDDDIILAFGRAKHVTDNRFELHLDWGKKCNFDCSYCPPTVHDNYSPFISLDKVRYLFDLLGLREHVGERSLTITGGEPTISEDLKELVNISKNDYHMNEIRVNTNGTGSRATYLWLIDHGVRSDITIHPEFTTRKILDKLLGIKDAAIKANTGEMIKFKCMGKPDSEFSLEVKQIVENYFQNPEVCPIEYVPIYLRGTNRIVNSLSQIKDEVVYIDDYKQDK